MTTQEAEQRTAAVFERHSHAFALGDLDGLLADYTEESVILTPDGRVEGLQELRAAFTEMFGDLFKPGTYTMTVDSHQIEGDVAYLVFHADCASVSMPLGTDTFVMRDGKIMVQTFTAKIDPK